MTIKADSEKIPVVEIFQSIQGESTTAGYPTTFIRLFGCNLRCKWCDTRYSYFPEEPEFYADVDEIVDEISKYNNNYICITGGEPLLYTDTVLDIINKLVCNDNITDISIETNGSLDIGSFIEARKSNISIKNKVRLIIDYKLITSGEEEKMLLSNYSFMDDNDEIKFVIGSEEDFRVAKLIIDKWYKKGKILFSPIWGQMPNDKLVKLLLENNLSKAKLSLQLHKIIWGPDTKKV